MFGQCRSEVVYSNIQSTGKRARTRAGLGNFHPNAFTVNLYIALLCLLGNESGTTQARTSIIRMRTKGTTQAPATFGRPECFSMRTEGGRFPFSQTSSSFQNILRKETIIQQFHHANSQRRRDRRFGAKTKCGIKGDCRGFEHQLPISCLCCSSTTGSAGNSNGTETRYCS